MQCSSCTSKPLPIQGLVSPLHLGDALIDITWGLSTPPYCPANQSGSSPPTAHNNPRRAAWHDVTMLHALQGRSICQFSTHRRQNGAL